VRRQRSGASSRDSTRASMSTATSPSAASRSSSSRCGAMSGTRDLGRRRSKRATPPALKSYGDDRSMNAWPWPASRPASPSELSRRRAVRRPRAQGEILSRGVVHRPRRRRRVQGEGETRRPDARSRRRSASAHIDRRSAPSGGGRSSDAPKAPDRCFESIERPSSRTSSPPTRPRPWIAFAVVAATGSAARLKPVAAPESAEAQAEAGGMFWFRRRTLSGSYRDLRSWRRANESRPNAAPTRSRGSSACM
jgi:hypothetical protein